MIDFTTNIPDDLERTQRLPTLIAVVQPTDAVQRERAARLEIVELLRQNVQQAKEIEQLRANQLGAPVQQAVPTIEGQPTTEEMLFVVCGALKDTLSSVLTECRKRRVSLNCASAARSTLEVSCDKLEQILSAPGFSAPAAYRQEVAQMAQPAPRLRLLQALPAAKSIAYPGTEHSGLT